MSLGGAVTPVPWFPAAGDLARITPQGYRSASAHAPGGLLCPVPPKALPGRPAGGPAASTTRLCGGRPLSPRLGSLPPEPGVAAA